jgi:DNA replication and repair protein RecF
MLIRRLKLQNFRNYQQQELVWDQRLNLLYGENAQGKSNLLEAICYLAIASSFRAQRDRELISHEQEHFYLEAATESEISGQMRLTVAVNREGKRIWTVNNQPKERLVDVVGLFHSVLFAPEDIGLVKAGPDSRRRYINRQMSQADRAYCRLLMQYNHILRQRNACLKTLNESSDFSQLDIWSEQLIRAGSEIMLRRAQTVALLQPLAQQLHQQLSGGEQLEIAYHCKVCGQEHLSSRQQVAELFTAALKRRQSLELLHGATATGPHRDDLQIQINGRPARDFASQGQQRTAALSLKLAEWELARELRGEYPVLLLDDVFSELDGKRRRQIMELAVDKTQTFISAVEDNLPQVQVANGGKWWQIVAGNALPLVVQ